MACEYCKNRDKYIASLKEEYQRVCEKELCGATLGHRDDFGDNTCTYRCTLPYRHRGRHQEIGEDFTIAWERSKDDRLRDLYDKANMRLYAAEEYRSINSEPAPVWAREYLSWGLYCLCREAEALLLLQKTRKEIRALRKRIKEAG